MYVWVCEVCQYKDLVIFWEEVAKLMEKPPFSQTTCLFLPDFQAMFQVETRIHKSTTEKIY